MRTGIDEKKNDPFKDIAVAAEESGIQMLTLHARTLKQGYSGKADWNKIRELKELVSLPIVGNGDITKPEDALRMMKETKCDYVMVGRGAIGNPYLFSQINDFLKDGTYREITTEEKINYFLKYIDYTKDFKIKFTDIKTHAMGYTKGIKGGSEARVNLGKAKDLTQVRELLESIKYR
jgi:tRNA-dihydrouridine synthase